jgi:signal peptidase I
MIAGAWLVEGLFVPVRIAGGSMAPAMLGVHSEAVCDDCRYEYVYDATLLEEQSVVCPNCGFRQAPSTASKAADRIVIDRTAYLRRLPRRWEVVVLRCPETGSYCAKRVVGLPGEQVEIRSGDVYVDGCIARKPLAVARSMEVMVHDDRFQPGAEALRRWRGDRWQRDGSRVALLAAANPAAFDSTDQEPAPLVYHHLRRLADPVGQSDSAEPAAIVDEYGYNQSGRPVHAVDDLILTFRLEASGSGSFTLRRPFDAGDWRAGNEAADRAGVELKIIGGQIHRIDAFGGSKSLAANFLDTPISLDSPRSITLATIDRQIVFAVDDVELLTVPLDGAPLAIPAHRKEDGLFPQARKGSTRPLAVAARGLSATVSDLRISRDVYYAPPRGHRALAANTDGSGYFVLGDNSPMSVDSRHFGPVPHKWLIGKPLGPIGR